MIAIAKPFHCAIASIIVTSIIAICILVYRVAFPTILSFPWRLPSPSSKSGRRKRERTMTVVFAGSFNPPHWGHLVMIRYLAERYGRVICCIGVNPDKRYDVSPQTRARILRKMLVGCGNAEGDDGRDGTNTTGCDNVQVQVVTGYIWRYARTQNASLFFRGIRTWDADGPDERKLQILNSWGPLLLGGMWPLRTIFLEGDPRYTSVSSTRTRMICGNVMRRRRGGDAWGRADGAKKNDDDDDDELSRLVPRCVLDDIVEAYGTNA